MGKELIKKRIQEIEVKNEDKWSIKAQRISAANFGALQKLLCWMSLALCMLGNISCFCCHLLTYFKINFFSKYFFQEHYQSVKQFGSTVDQNVGPDLGPNFLQR